MAMLPGPGPRYPSQLFSCTLCLLTTVTQWESQAHFSKWHTDASKGTHLGKAKAEGLGSQSRTCLSSAFVSRVTLVHHLCTAPACWLTTTTGQALPQGTDRLDLRGPPLSPLPSAPPPPLPVTQSVPRALTLSLSCRKRSRTWMVRRGHHQQGRRRRTVSGTSVLMTGPDRVGGGLCSAGDPRSWGSSARGRDGVGQWPELGTERWSCTMDVLPWPAWTLGPPHAPLDFGVWLSHPRGPS